MRLVLHLQDWWCVGKRETSFPVNKLWLIYLPPSLWPPQPVQHTWMFAQTSSVRMTSWMCWANIGNTCPGDRPTDGTIAVVRSCFYCKSSTKALNSTRLAGGGSGLYQPRSIKGAVHKGLISYLSFSRGGWAPRRKQQGGLGISEWINKNRYRVVRSRISFVA